MTRDWSVVFPKSSRVCFLLVLLFACNDGLLEYRDYNPRLKADIDREYVRRLRRFNVEKSVSTESAKHPDGLRRTTLYLFKSARPIRRDATGNYYYRWDLSIEEYESVEAAVRKFNRSYSRMVKPEGFSCNGNPGVRMELKGNNSRTIISGKFLYQVSASCLEGRHLDRWFRRLLSVILARKRPDKSTVLTFDCGGYFGIE